MAYITAEELRNRVPNEGDGITDGEIDEAIASAVEQVVGLTGDADGASALAQTAVAALAQARILDIIHPRDARDRETLQFTLRASAEADIAHYLEIERNKGGDNDVRWTDVPPVTITQTRQPVPYTDATNWLA